MTTASRWPSEWSERDVVRSAAPFVLIVLLAFATIPISDVSVHVDLVLSAAALAVVIALAIFLLPWPRLPRWLGLVPPFAGLLIVALLRQAEHGAISGYAAMVLVSVLWLALYGSRLELIAMITAAALTLTIPIIIFGAPEYPVSEWRRALLLTALATFIGLVTQDLVFSVRERVEEAERAAARERERETYVRTVMNTASEGIVAIDTEGNSTFVNPTAARMYGYSLVELQGRGMHELVHHSRGDGSPYPAAECPIETTVRTGRGCVVSNEVFWRKDGSSFPVEYRAAAMNDDGRVTGAVVTFTDISERLAVERMKDEFISVVSHELRTPLTAIRGSLGLVQGGAAGDVSSEANQMLSIAISNADRLVRLINDVLDVERIEAGKLLMAVRPCELAELMESTRELLAPTAQQARVVLDVRPAAARLEADPDRIIQVLVNLIGNAIKFSPPGGTVIVTGGQRGRRVRVSVRDQGPGVPVDKRATIFDRFVQVDSADARQKGGSGLGLAIARGIVEQHGGRIWVESVEGEGSVFAFELPIDAGA